MRKADRWLLAISVLTGLGFVAGLVHLFTLRFESGDIYPAYSSLRPDPLGTRALFESLDRLEAVGARRHYEDIDKAEGGEGTTLMLLGMYPARRMVTLSAWELDELEDIARRGGRVVLAFVPITSPGDRSLAMEQDDAPTAPQPLPGIKPRKKPAKDSDGADQDQQTNHEPVVYAGSEEVAMTERWGFGFKFDFIKRTPFEPAEPPEVNLVASDIVGLPQTLQWHSSTYFDDLDPAWKVVYQRGTNAVVAERTFDKGAVVLVSDAYLLSNEALSVYRQPEVIAWLVGNGTDVVFDETHLGITEPTGFMILARKFRLQGLFAALIILGILYVWKNATSFIPPADDDDLHARRTDIADGRDSAAALVNLLRRTIPRSDLIAACVGEWRKTIPRDAKHLRPKLDRIHQVLTDQQSLPPRQRDPIGAYRTISRILNERKH
jgi:hypothetical protein